MSYNNNNNTHSGQGYGQWSGYGSGDPSYYGQNTGYPQTAYNPDAAQNYQQQYIDPRSTMYSASSSSSGYGQSSYGYADYSGSMYPPASSHGNATSPYGARPGTAPPQACAAPYSYPTSSPGPAQIQLTEGPPPTTFSSASGVKTCSHCGATSTPVWRRDPRTHAPLCNACGVYRATRGAPRPQTLIDVDREMPGPGVDDPNAPSCTHCGTRKTSAWRRNKARAQVCNACGVYERMNGRPRPLELRSDKVRPREKHRS